MNQEVKDSVAASMDIKKKLLPLLPYLIQDLWVMGSSIDQIFSGIELLHLPELNTVLDLCCGKGGLSVQIAKKFGYRVTGVDAMSVFLKTAERKAGEFKVAHLCRFIQEDVNEFTSIPRKFDLVILAAAGPVFGDIKQTMEILRSQVKVGGFIFIDDCYLPDGSQVMNRKGYKYYLDYKDTRDALLSFGDQMIAEIKTDDAQKNINSKYQRLIKNRGAELIKNYPELEKDIRNYIQEQSDECDILERKLRSMLWIVQKYS